MALSLNAAFTVATRGSGQLALELLADWQPDLVLLDVMMPEIDGPATLARMRFSNVTREIPIIFMTAKALPQDINRFLKLGAIGVISKPFDPMQLPQRVQEIWDASFNS
ncbi:MAG: response regulator [Candidatus Obscuribacterales bacterium]|nr:response regulator [Steroidobacteraceae bacterium]